MRFVLQIRGYVAAGSSKQHISGSGNMSSVDGLVAVQYHYFHIYGGSDPSMCEVYFLISAKVRDFPVWGDGER